MNVDSRAFRGLLFKKAESAVGVQRFLIHVPAGFSVSIIPLIQLLVCVIEENQSVVGEKRQVHGAIPCQLQYFLDP